MTDSSRSWGDLPLEVLNLIRQRLFHKDYSNFRATCRGWNFKEVFDPLLYRNLKYPLLLRFPERDSSYDLPSSASCCYQAYAPSYHKSYYVQAPSELLGTQIHCSNYGWLLLSQKESMFFHHPSTNDIIHLPDVSTQASSFNRIGFSVPPTSPDCVVFGLMDSCYKKKVYIGFIRRGQQSWNYGWFQNTMLRRKSTHRRRCRMSKRRSVKTFKFKAIPSRIGSFLWSNSSSYPVFHKGAFYCLAQDGRLGIFNPNKKKKTQMWRLLDTTTTKRPPDHVFMDNQANIPYLVEWNGELMSMVVDPMAEFVRIYKFHEPTKAWQVVSNLEDQMVFLGPTSCAAALECSNEAQNKGLENTIHFPMFHESDRHVFYSLSSEQFHSSEAEYPSIDLSSTRLLLNRAWMVPSFHFFSGAQLRWASKIKKRRPRTKTEPHHRVHPHYVIRNLTLSSSSCSTGASKGINQLEDHVENKRNEEDLPTGKVPLVHLFNLEDESTLFRLTEGTLASSHSRYPELAARIAGKEVYNSVYGTLVLVDAEARRCSLLDPVSMVETMLPTWEMRISFSFAMLHVPQGESKFVVMAFGVVESDGTSSEGDDESDMEIQKNDTTTLAMFWRDGDDEWTIHTTSGDEQQGDNELTGAVAVYQDKIYAYPKTKFELVSIELRQEKFTTKPLPQVGFPDSPKGTDDLQVYLVESSGELLLFVQHNTLGREARRDPSIIDMQVFKMDSEVMRWRLVNDLGDRAFFLSNWGCRQCCASKSGLKGNSIYYTGDAPQDLCLFDYGDHSISVSRPCDDNWALNGFIMFVVNCNS